MTCGPRTLAASDAWSIHFPGLANPYADVLQFLDAGGEIGRWEENVLDMTLPDGEGWGIPLATFEGLASGAIQLPASVTAERPVCPACGSAGVARLVYGLIDPRKISEELASGRTRLAGCLVEASSPAWHCNHCGSEWGLAEAATRLAERQLREDVAREKREAEARQRGTLEAVLRSTGLARCPHCRRSFDTRSRMSWDGARHLSCGTYLTLIHADDDA